MSSRAAAASSSTEDRAGPDHRLEDQADRVGRRVLQTPEGKPGLLTHVHSFARANRPDVIPAGGEPLPQPVRHFFESRFAHDFTQVRIHTDARAEELAQEQHARAYTVGSHIVFGRGQLSPLTPQGKQLIAHELAHVVQQNSGTFAGAIQRACLPAAACAASPGSAVEFVTDVENQELAARTRRSRMSPVRQRSSGHTGRAKQLEIFFEAHAPGLLANIHGIFIDWDMSQNVAASTQACDTMIPPITGATKPCVFVPAKTNQEALIFNTKPAAATIGGESRETWRIDTIQTLIHEVQHVRYDDAKTGAPRPAGVACPRSDVEFELSELTAILSEFPSVFDAVPAAAPAADPARKRLDDWFDFAITNDSESIRGTLKAIRCKCSCPDADAYVKETCDFVMAPWTPAQKTALHTELRKPKWTLTWPL